MLNQTSQRTFKHLNDFSEILETGVGFFEVLHFPFSQSSDIPHQRSAIGMVSYGCSVTIGVHPENDKQFKSEI